MLRNNADIRSVFYMIFTTGLLVVQWNLPEINWFLFTLGCFMAVSITVMSHNHNHLQMWKSKGMNVFTDYWLTLFYGFPVFAWIPTHNKNHHKFTNKEGDYTITYRISEANNLYTLLTYPTISSYYQQRPIRDYLKRNWDRRPSRFWYCISQYVILVAFLAVAFWVDWKKALFFIFIPQQVGLFSVLIFNYLQHVHADEESKWNHSRNIVGPVMNAFLFNNGYHTIHHIKPGLHWSETKREHAKIAHHIDDDLLEPSFWWLIIRVYILGLFSKKFRTRSMRAERMQHEDVAAESHEMAAAE